MNVVSLFSGIGGLDKGFSDSGFNVIWANDFDKYAVETYRRNYDNEIVLGDINQIPFVLEPVSTIGELEDGKMKMFNYYQQGQSTK